jgi:hypothetical protein
LSCLVQHPALIWIKRGATDVAGNFATFIFYLYTYKAAYQPPGHRNSGEGFNLHEKAGCGLTVDSASR